MFHWDSYRIVANVHSWFQQKTWKLFGSQRTLVYISNWVPINHKQWGRALSYSTAYHDRNKMGSQAVQKRVSHHHRWSTYKAGCFMNESWTWNQFLKHFDNWSMQDIFHWLHADEEVKSFFAGLMQFVVKRCHIIPMNWHFNTFNRSNCWKKLDIWSEWSKTFVLDESLNTLFFANNKVTKCKSTTSKS